MKRKCPCGKTHDFVRFRCFKTTFGGKTSHYQHFCKKLGKLMMLTTTTFPPSLTMGLCPETTLKKFTKIESIVPSDEFQELYLLAQKVTRECG